MCETLGLSAGEKTQQKNMFFSVYKHVLEKPLRRGKRRSREELATNAG